MEQKHYFKLLSDVSRYERKNKMTFGRVIQFPGSNDMKIDDFKKDGELFKYVALVNKENPNER